MRTIKYDYEIGRFTNVDPLWEKYTGWTGYQYSGNNPIWAKDWDGKEIQAESADAQETILSLIPENLRQNIVFDENGCLDNSIINSISSTSNNFFDIKLIANSSTDVELMISDKISFFDQDGKLNTMDLGGIKVDKSWKAGAYSLSTKELGWLGQTLVPGNSNMLNSPDNKVYVYINSNLSKLGRSENASHEFLGHTLLYILGLKSDHIILPGGFEGNLELKSQIINSTNETIKNNGGN